MSADTQLESILNSVLKEVCMRGDFIHAEALKPAGNTCMVQGGAYYNANANAADFHKASLNFHYPQFACMPGRVWKTQQTEWHKDVSTLPQAIFVRAALAKVTGLRACYAIPLTRQGHVVSVVVFYSRQVIPYDEQLESTVFTLANDMLKDICQRFGQTQLQFVRNGKTSLTRRPRTGTSKVWECAKASLDTEADNRTEADMENIVKFSKRLPFFKYVSTAAREALCRRMEHIVLQEGELAIKEPKDMDFVWFIVVKGRCDMMFKTEDTGKHYPIRAFEEGDTFAYSYLKMLTGDANAQEHGDIRAREANTSVVRVYVEEEHRGDFRSQTKPLLYEELAKYFNMSADQAADRLGLCMSAIKKICRRHGIIRWPHRKLLSANKSLALIDSKMAEVEQTPQGQAMLRNDALSILVSKLRVMLNPTYLVNSELVHSTTGGGQHTPGRADEMFELEGSLSPNSDDGSDEESPHEVGGGFKRKKNGKAGLHDKDERFKKSRGHERGHDNHVDHRGIENGPGRDNWRPTTNGADGGGNMSIEHMSDMVRASLEQVPENVREQVLSLVITNMQSSKASKHGRAQEHNMLSGAGGWNSQPQHLHPMSGRHHPYLPISNSMHPTRRSNQSVHYPISHVSAPQSLEGNPNYVMEGGAYSHASRDSSGFNQHLVLPRYGPDANATRNDDSSDDEGAPPTSSADKWSGHHSLNRYAQQGMPGAGWNLQNLGPLDRILQNSSAMPGGPGGGIDMPGVRGGPHGQMNPSVLGRGPMGHVGNRNHEPNQRPGERKILPPIPAVKSPVGSNPPSSLHFLESSVGKDDRQPSGKGMELLGMLSAPVDGEGQASGAGAMGGQGEVGGGGGGGGEGAQGQQGALWANIHLLCDLLGGPLSQVAQGVSAAQSRQDPKSSR